MSQGSPRAVNQEELPNWRRLSRLLRSFLLSCSAVHVCLSGPGAVVFHEFVDPERLPSRTPPSGGEFGPRTPTSLSGGFGPKINVDPTSPIHVCRTPDCVCGRFSMWKCVGAAIAGSVYQCPLPPGHCRPAASYLLTVLFLSV